MKFGILTLVLLALAVPAGATPRQASPFTGRYAEPSGWGLPSGDSDIRISSSGAISGTTIINFGPSDGAMDPIPSMKFEFRGIVTDAGAMSLTVKQSWTSAQGVKGRVTFTEIGQAVLDAEGDVNFAGTRTYASGVTEPVSRSFLHL